MDVRSARLHQILGNSPTINGSHYLTTSQFRDKLLNQFEIYYSTNSRYHNIPMIVAKMAHIDPMLAVLVL